MQGRQQCGPGWVSHILQALVLELWSEPRRAASRCAARAATYSARRKRLLGCLQRRGMEAHGASGLNVWIPVPEEAGAVGGAAAARLGRGARCALPPRPAAPAMRVTIATLTAAEAEQLAADIADALAPAGGPAADSP